MYVLYVQQHTNIVDAFCLGGWRQINLHCITLMTLAFPTGVHIRTQAHAGGQTLLQLCTAMGFCCPEG